MLIHAGIKGKTRFLSHIHTSRSIRCQITVQLARQADKTIEIPGERRLKEGIDKTGG